MKIFSRKGQLSIFLLMGTVFLIIFGVVILLEEEGAEKSVFEEQTVNLQIFENNVQSFQTFTETCLRQTAIKALGYYNQEQQKASKKEFEVKIKPHQFVNLYLKLEAPNCLNETLFPTFGVDVNPPMLIEVEEGITDINVKIQLKTIAYQGNFKKEIEEYSFNVPKNLEETGFPVNSLVVDGELFQFFLPLSPKDAEYIKQGEAIVSYSRNPLMSPSYEEKLKTLPVKSRKKMFSDIFKTIQYKSKEVENLIKSLQYDEILVFDESEISFEELESELKKFSIVTRVTRNKQSFSSTLVSVSSFRDAMRASSNFLNDHFYRHQWYLQNDGQHAGKPEADIRIRNVWNQTDEATTVISVIDEGVAANPDLVQNIIYEKSYNFFDNTHNINPISSEEIHGTHVAGVIASKRQNRFGIAGVCPNCKIMNMRIFSPGAGGDSTDLINAILYSAAHGAEIISMSLGGPAFTEYEQHVINHLAGEGIIFVAAAGNDGVDQKSYPAAYENVISVGATDNTDERAVFSNHGNWVHIYAPGEQILSTCSSLTYCFSSGTSMATPLVSGIIGLMKSKDPELNYREALDIIKRSADKTPAGPRINTEKALEETDKLVAQKNSLKFN